MNKTLSDEVFLLNKLFFPKEYTAYVCSHGSTKKRNILPTFNAIFFDQSQDFLMQNVFNTRYKAKFRVLRHYVYYKNYIQPFQFEIIVIKSENKKLKLPYINCHIYIHIYLYIYIYIYIYMYIVKYNYF